MAFVKPKLTPTYIKPYPLVRSRIKIPQPVTRPVDIHARDLVRQEDLRQDPWWMTIHKRGVRRAKVGEDPLEARAVPKYKVKGTLPERIIYKAFTDLFHWMDGVEFNFQSSQDGGRVELGGIVADFLLFQWKMIIQVQGPTHGEYLRIKKDEEQKAILEDMGYRVFDIEEEIIYNEYRLEDWLRRVFNLSNGIGSGGTFNAYYETDISSDGAIANSEKESSDDALRDYIYNLLIDASNILHWRNP